MASMPNGTMPMMPGGAPGAQGMPGVQAPLGQDSLGDMAVKALDQLTPKSPSSNQAMQRANEALDLAHKLLVQVLPQISNVNPKVSRDIHQISQRILSAKLEMVKEMPIAPPPEELMSLLDAESMPMPQAGPGLGSPM